MLDEQFLVDTNVLVYSLDPDSKYHAASRKLINSARSRSQRLFLTPQIISEFYAVVTDRRRVPNPRNSNEALDVIDHILAFPGITMLPQPADFVALWTKLARRYPIVGAKIYDLHLVATMLAYNIRSIYTYDEVDFQRYEEIQVKIPSVD